MVAHTPVILVLRRQKQDGLCEFQDCQGHIAKTTQQSSSDGDDDDDDDDDDDRLKL